MSVNNYKLNIALIQSSLHWQAPEANLAMFEEKIWGIDSAVDIIVLPEMFNTGFSMKSEELAEVMNSKTFRWMKQMAAQTSSVITGSFIVNEKGRYYNRLIWMSPDGQFQKYDKRHLFRMADEHDYFDAGTERIICEWKDWRICPMICYDLRFPVWSRNVKPGSKDFDYDLLLYVANWPAARINAWDALLKARAIENLAFAAGVNRTGKDGNEIPYNGHSAVYDGKGQCLTLLDEKEQSQIVTLDKTELLDLRAKFPANLDADRFTVL